MRPVDRGLARGEAQANVNEDRTRDITRPADGQRAKRQRAWLFLLFTPPSKARVWWPLNTRHTHEHLPLSETTVPRSSNSRMSSSTSSDSSTRTSSSAESSSDELSSLTEERLAAADDEAAALEGVAGASKRGGSSCRAGEGWRMLLAFAPGRMHANPRK